MPDEREQPWGHFLLQWLAFLCFCSHLPELLYEIEIEIAKETPAVVHVDDVPMDGVS